MNELPINKTEIESIVVQECKLKGYSQKTIDNYLHHIKKFVSSGKQPRDFLLALIEKGDSDETVISAGFAIKCEYSIHSLNGGSGRASFIQNIHILRNPTRANLVSEQSSNFVNGGGRVSLEFCLNTIKSPLDD